MYEHIKKKWILTDCLDEMYWLWFRLAYYDKDLKISVWDKKITKTVNKTVWVKDEQWWEFRDKYKTIKDSGLSDNGLIVKYNKLDRKSVV